MRRQSRAVRVPGMAKITRAVTHDATLWTELIVAGKRVYIRTPRPLRPAPEPRESPLGKGPDPPAVEVRTVVAEGEP